MFHDVRYILDTVEQTTTFLRDGQFAAWQLAAVASV